MTVAIEQRLRDLFEFDASRAPASDGLAAAASQRVRRRRRRLMSGVAVAAVVLGAAAGGAIRPQDPAKVPVVASSWDASRSGPLPEGGAASCVEQYSTATVAHRAFAFDGTVVGIGPPRSNRPGVELALAGVTFRVNQWFRGGSARTVVVDMEDPSLTWDGRPGYEVGTRLLVSGEPRWGGTPMTAAIAWGCGFTRYYDPGTAAQWAR